MSKRIARLLDEPEHQVTKLIAKLEDKNGYPSHDARLLAGTIQKIRSKLADLNLDPDDTTAEELYHALQVKYERDARLFDEYFGTDPDYSQKAAKAIKLLEPYAKDARQWGLKTKAAKDIIRRQPPKRLMKHLNYRSVESLLKREAIAEIYLASTIFESASWQKSHKKLVSQLDQTSFEVRSVKLIALDSKKWDTGEQGEIIVHNEEIAALGICPAASVQGTPLLSLVLLLADALSNYADVRPSQIAAHLNNIVAWWADMDHLITELSGQPVSLNLKDCAANHLQARVFGERSMKHGREAFWRELVSHYGNLPDIDGLFDETVRQKVAGLKFSGPEPAYEFVEDF